MSRVQASERPVAFITGASRGIGRAVAIELAGAGYDIVGNATSYDPDDTKKGLAEVELRVAERGRSFLAAPGDVADLDAHESMIDAAAARFGHVDLLVNNAGVAPLTRTDMLEMTPESYDRVMGINTRGTFFLTQSVARQMLRQPASDARQAIVFVSSISAVVSSPNRAEYCMSKAAISHAARIFADRLAEHGVNVYEIRPGVIATDMTAAVAEKYDRIMTDGTVPQRRWGQAEDIAHAVAALVGGDFAYATGLVVEVSGGMNIRRL